MCNCESIILFSLSQNAFSGFLSLGYELDYVFDWTILKYQQAQKSKTQPRMSVSMIIFSTSSRKCFVDDIELRLVHLLIWLLGFIMKRMTMQDFSFFVKLVDVNLACLVEK